MEPELITDSKFSDVLEQLKKLEPIFHHPGSGGNREDFEKMTEKSFWEVGASGRRYSRDFVLDVLEDRIANPQKDNWQTNDFFCQEIAPDNFLLTYTLIQKERVTRRATIWRRHRAQWKIVYHQGTVVENYHLVKSKLNLKK